MGSPTLPSMRNVDMIIFLRPFLAVVHQEPNGGWCRVKNGDAIAFDQIPPTAGIGIVRFPFGGEDRRAVQQRTVDDITVSGDPAGIGDAEVDIVVFRSNTYFVVMYVPTMYPPWTWTTPLGFPVVPDV